MTEKIPFECNIEVYSSDFEEANSYLNSVVDDREIIPVSSKMQELNIISSQTLNNTIMFAGGWSAEVKVRSQPLTGIQAIFVFKGAINCNATNNLITAGSMLLISPGTSVDFTWTEGARAVVTSFGRNTLFDYLGLENSASIIASSRIFPSEHKTTQEFNGILSCLTNQHTCRSGRISRKIQEYWEGILIELLANKMVCSENRIDSVLPRDIRRACDWIHDNIRSSVAVSDLIKLTGCCRRSIETGFKKYVGMSPANYIAHKKMCEIRRILKRDPGVRISDIAFQFGFAQPGHLSRKYKETFGEPPTKSAQRFK